MPAFAAVDLGASSGRVIRAEVGAAGVHLEEVARFETGAHPDEHGTLRWDAEHLITSVLDGLAAAGARGPLDGIGIDTWAVDYGLLDSGGRLLADPIAYRDDRTERVLERVHAALDQATHYALTGIAHQPFNTVYQLAAEAQGPLWESADQVLLMPDLIAHHLTGVGVAERTNASTTGLLGLDGQWSQQVLEAAGITGAPLAELVDPGTVIGHLSDRIQDRTGLGAVPVFAVGSHDTASAVAGVPGLGPHGAFLSCGTWSLIGLELPEPVATEAAQLAGITNERGVDGTIRFLRNVMGLWLLSESLRTWSEAGAPVELGELLSAAADAQPRRTVVHIDHPDFFPPGDMPERIRRHASGSGQPEPGDATQVVRCILDSLALAYRRALEDLRRLTGRRIETVHLVGGGARNALLCQLTADATGLPVQAGPEESTALGNVLVQARAAGVLTGSLADLRAEVAHSVPTTRYEPDLHEHRQWNTWTDTTDGH